MEGQFLSEAHMFLFLVQLFVILMLARGFGELFKRWRQPALTAEILVGIVLGPSILGRFLPGVHAWLFPADPIQQNMLETVAWLGVLFLLLESGLEVDFSSVWRQRGSALKVALIDIVVPMAIAFACTLLLPASYLVDPADKLLFALFAAAVMTISDMPVALRALHDLNLFKTDLGFLVMSALSVNDIIGWLIFTIVLGVFSREGASASQALTVTAMAVGFAALCLGAGRRLADRAITAMQKRKLSEPAASLTFITLLGMLTGAITLKIGIHALFGFFLAGIMAGESRALPEYTRQVISQMVYAVFVPLFFVNVGLKIDVIRYFDLFLVVFFSVIGIGGRWLGAWIGSRFTDYDRHSRMTIAIAHIPGGVMAIVVSLLAVEAGLITEPVFVAIVASAVISSVVVGPWLGWSVERRRVVQVSELLSPEGVIANLSTDSVENVIRQLCEQGERASGRYLPAKKEFIEAVLSRERAMGTGLEMGIAVPHARLDGVRRPVVVFGRASEGIDWNSPDGRPARFIFLIATSPTEDVQVQILSAIASVMKEERVRDSILHARDEHALYRILRHAFGSRTITRHKNS